MDSRISLQRHTLSAARIGVKAGLAVIFFSVWVLFLFINVSVSCGAVCEML
jgi:hypothetical protein